MLQSVKAWHAHPGRGHRLLYCYRVRQPKPTMSYLKPAILALSAIGLALCAGTYGRTIASSPADHAAPLAAPFLLCAGASLATFAAAGAAAGDAASRRQR